MDDGRGRGGRAQSADVGRSRRLNSASRSVHSAAARIAWRTIHGSTRLESSIVSVGPDRSVVDLDPRAVAVVGHPVGLELERHIGHDRHREQPVEIRRVQPVGDVGQADRPAALEPGDQVDDPDVVKGSRASPTVGGVIAGSGMPAGAGRNGPSPMVAVGASVTTGASPSGVTRDWRV